jgi:hypothetical protein
MKKLNFVKPGVLVTAALLAGGSGTVAAEQFTITSPVTFFGSDDTGQGPTATTAPISQLQHNYWSSTVVTDANNDGKYNDGDTSVGSGGFFYSGTMPGGSNTLAENLILGFLPAAFDNNYRSFNGDETWVLSFGWNDLVANVVEVAPGVSTLIYESGTIHVYYADTLSGRGGATNDLNSLTIPTDPGTLGDFTEVLTLNVVAGGGNAIGQSLDLAGVVTSTDTTDVAFKWASDGTLWDALKVSFLADQNTSPWGIDGVPRTDPLETDEELYNAVGGTFVLEGQHNGSISFGRVPVPGTLALLGLGLLGMSRLPKRGKAHS